MGQFAQKTGRTLRVILYLLLTLLSALTLGQLITMMQTEIMTHLGDIATAAPVLFGVLSWLGMLLVGLGIQASVVKFLSDTLHIYR